MKKHLSLVSRCHACLALWVLLGALCKLGGPPSILKPWHHSHMGGLLFFLTIVVHDFPRELHTRDPSADEAPFGRPPSLGVQMDWSQTELRPMTFIWRRASCFMKHTWKWHMALGKAVFLAPTWGVGTHVFLYGRFRDGSLCWERAARRALLLPAPLPRLYPLRRRAGGTGSVSSDPVMPSQYLVIQQPWMNNGPLDWWKTND